MNDDYCDFGDDEPTTSACSMMKGKNAKTFQCNNTKYLNKLIFSSRIGDGICDCCDGSDETEGVCSNECENLGLLVEMERKRKIENLNLGLKAKKDLIEESNKVFNQIQNDHINSEVIVPEYQKQVSSLKLRLQDEKEIENQEYEQLFQNSKILIKTYLNSLGSKIAITRSKLSLFIAALTIRGKEDSVEAVLLECDELYELPGDDPDDSEAITLAMPDYAVPNLHTEVVQMNIDGSQRPDASISSGNIGNPILTIEILHKMCNVLSLERLTEASLWTLLLNTLIRISTKSTPVIIDQATSDSGITSFVTTDIGLIILEKLPVYTSRASFKRPQVDTIKSQIDYLEKRINRIKESSRVYERINKTIGLSMDYLIALWGKCFRYSTSSGEYKYEVCLFADAKQNNLRLGQYTSYEIFDYRDVSTSAGFDEGTTEKHVKLLFTNGERCFATKRGRTMEVMLSCSLESELVDVSEPEVCSYAAVLKTPLACGL